MVILDDVIQRLKDKLGLSKNFELADIIGISAPDFSKRKKTGTLLPLILDIAISEKVNLDWLFTGIEAGSLEEKTETNVIDSEHTDIIRQFKDKERARDANLNLLKMERANPIAFIETCAFIRGMTSGVQVINTDRRVEERRQIDDQNRIPKGTDRRSGTGRRTANGKI